MKLTASQSRLKTHMKKYDGIFVVMKFQGNMSSRKYTKVRYCERGNLARLLDEKALSTLILNQWTEQGFLNKQPSYQSKTNKFGEVLVTEYHLNEL